MRPGRQQRPRLIRTNGGNASHIFSRSLHFYGDRGLQKKQKLIPGFYRHWGFRMLGSVPASIKAAYQALCRKQHDCITGTLGLNILLKKAVTRLGPPQTRALSALASPTAGISCLITPGVRSAPRVSGDLQ